MALSDDQKAMLRLLAQREEGYEDIAALLGLSVSQVRAKVKDALAELDDAGETSPAPAPPPTREPEPVAQEPTAPPEPAPSPSPPPAQRAPRPAPARPRVSLPKDRRRLIELAGAALVVLLLVLFATGAVNLGGDDGDDSGSGTTPVATTPVPDNVTRAVLAAPDGGDAVGQAVFGRVGKGPVLQVQAEGLEPSPEGESYTVWLYRSPKLALRVGSVKVGDEGGIAAQFPVPTELLSYVAGGAFNQIFVSLTEDAAYKAEIAQAKKQKRLPAYSGTTALSGEIVGPLIQKK